MTRLSPLISCADVEAVVSAKVSEDYRIYTTIRGSRPT
jgi:hypothetical protein